MDALRLFRLSGTAAFCGRVMAGDMVRITQGADRPVPASLGTSTCLPGVQETPRVPGKMLAGQDGDGLLTYSMVDLFGAEGKPDLVVLTPELNPKALAAVKAFLPGRDGGTWTVSPDGRLAVLAVPDPETEP